MNDAFNFFVKVKYLSKFLLPDKSWTGTKQLELKLWAERSGIHIYYRDIYIWRLKTQDTCGKLHVQDMNSSKYTWLTVLYPTAIKILWIENCLLLMCHYDGVWIGLWIFLTNVPINVKDVMYYVNSDSDLFAISHPNCLASWWTCYTIIKEVKDQVIWLFLNSYQLSKWYQNLIEQLVDILK